MQKVNRQLHKNMCFFVQIIFSLCTKVKLLLSSQQKRPSPKAPIEHSEMDVSVGVNIFLSRSECQAFSEEKQSDFGAS